MMLSQGTEQLLGNTNTLNRKLEESIAVGQEFEPISNLWGQFVDIMSSSGLNPQAASEAATTKAHAEGQPILATATGSAGEVRDLARSGSVDDNDDTLPPGVAPGGGAIYGRS